MGEGYEVALHADEISNDHSSDRECLMGLHTGIQLRVESFIPGDDFRGQIEVQHHIVIEEASIQKESLGSSLQFCL